jgi:hypothetical protein
MSALTFEPSTHTYYLDGVAVPRSVTGILKAAGLIDFSHVPGPILDAARERGSVVHRAIHYYNERDLDLVEFFERFPDYAPYLRGWIDFRERRSFTPVLCEHRVASRRYAVAGTIDVLGLLDNHAWLLDFATGSPDDVSKDLQTAGYLLIAREWADEDPALDAFFAAHVVVKRAAVALRADGSYSVHAYADPLDTRHFLALVDAQRIVDARKESRYMVTA